MDRRPTQSSTTTLLLQSGDGSPLKVIFEPWGSEYELRGDESLTVTVTSDEGGEIEVVHRSGSVVLWPSGKTGIDVVNGLGERLEGLD